MAKFCRSSQWDGSQFVIFNRRSDRCCCRPGSEHWMYLCWTVSNLGPVSISEKTSFRKISSSLEAARFVFRIVRSPWNLTGTSESAAVLPMCLSNFRAIRQFKVPISWLRDFPRSYGKTSFRILRRGPVSRMHDDIIKWKHFPRYWPFVRGIHRSPVNSKYKSQWRGALVFSMICAWIYGLANKREAGDLRRHRAHYVARCNVNLSTYVNIVEYQYWYIEDQTK